MAPFAPPSYTYDLKPYNFENTQDCFHGFVMSINANYVTTGGVLQL